MANLIKQYWENQLYHRFFKKYEEGPNFQWWRNGYFRIALLTRGRGGKNTKNIVDDIGVGILEDFSFLRIDLKYGNIPTEDILYFFDALADTKKLPLCINLEWAQSFMEKWFKHG